jgi:hypothetical protein
MAKVILPSGLGQLCIPDWDNAPHIQEMESQFLALARGEFRRLLLSIPVRHGKSELANLFIAWLLISKPTLRILRVMASADTARDKARDVLKYVEKWGPILTGVKLDRRRCAAEHFCTEAGGMLRSLGAAGDAESWTFNFILLDDVQTDPYEIRSPNRREQLFKDMNTKFFSRVDPLGNTKFITIGSRRHPDDFAGRLLESDRQTKPNNYNAWHYHHRAALIDEDGPTEHCLWPTSREFTVEGLKRIRDAKIADGLAWEWHSAYQNNPVASPDLLIFDPSWFDENMFYSYPREALPHIAHVVISFDPSMGDGSDCNDYFACLCSRFTGDGYIYVDDSYLAQASPDTAIEMSVALIARNQDVEIVVMEANAGGRYVGKCIQDACAARGLRCPIVYKTWDSNAQKLDNNDQQGRITLALWEKLSKEKIKLRDTPWNRTLYRQLRGFPTEKDDGPDCLATADIVLRQLILGKRA